VPHNTSVTQGIEQIVVTNTVPLNSKAAELKNIKVLSIAPSFGESDQVDP
jgi:phosphoribosylpyrophosphate synthetase